MLAGWGRWASLGARRPALDGKRTGRARHDNGPERRPAPAMEAARGLRAGAAEHLCLPQKRDNADVSLVLNFTGGGGAWKVSPSIGANLAGRRRH